MSKTAEVWLSLDLASNPGSIALHRVETGSGPRLMIESTVGEKWSQSEKVYGLLGEILHNSKTPLSQVDRYLTIDGPGSFTGLRLSMSVLKAFSLVSGRPIETQSACEVRALAFLSRNAELMSRFKRLQVVTYATTRKWVCSQWSRTESSWLCDEERVLDGPFEFDSSDTYVIFDNEAKPTDWHPERMAHFPLKASFLAETLTLAQSRKKHHTIQEIVVLSPRYFASAKLTRIG
jgi:tRNA A37 threonylcarbamoyladenosine modification protein TsaB